MLNKQKWNGLTRRKGETPYQPNWEKILPLELSFQVHLEIWYPKLGQQGTFAHKSYLVPWCFLVPSVWLPSPRWLLLFLKLLQAQQSSASLDYTIEQPGRGDTSRKGFDRIIETWHTPPPHDADVEIQTESQRMVDFLGSKLGVTKLWCARL